MGSENPILENLSYDEFISKKGNIPKRVIEEGYSKEDIERIDNEGDLEIRKISRSVIGWMIKSIGLGIALSISLFFIYVSILGAFYICSIYDDFQKIETILVAFLKYGLAVALGFLVNKVWGSLSDYK
uniref:Uncharacterized protein n=1 Tax=Candidatus Kentrum sp. TUN TaxID=2126343 RepID=A0A451AUT1_9GAMM|nr:MAG: hypothetical protein BECKTUN1418F_GA0071002_12156 [Candidatus Kentron sp. TUN]VFK69809.1 MAG: hypothetical protein BECKTUN1418E_GA0071001_12146 [Candidatus Kentron sp. TUN]